MMEEPILQEGLELAGRYRVGKLLGRGGMGAVYEGHHAELGRSVAIKVLLPKFAEDQEVLARFFREARAAAAIRHPGIVEILDLGRHERLAFIVMEKLEGEELTERIRYWGRLGPHFVAHFGAQLADAMAAAHESGVVHRDLKPQNVFLAKQAGGRELVKVLDFGIAKLIDADSSHTPLTRTGEVFGTPMYMAPEQLRAVKDIDARADIYAIGVILREALTGQSPYDAASLPDLMVKIVSEPVRPLELLRPGLPSELVSVISRAMEKDRAARFATARELSERLAAIAAMLPPDQTEIARDPSEPGRADSDTELGPRLDQTTPSPHRSIGLLASLPPAPQALATNPPALLPVTTPGAPASVPTPSPALVEAATPQQVRRPWLLVGGALAVVAAVAVIAARPTTVAETSTVVSPARSAPEVPDAAIATTERPPEPPLLQPPPVAPPERPADPPKVVAPPTSVARPSRSPAPPRPPTTSPEPQPELLNR